MRAYIVLILLFFPSYLASQICSAEWQAMHPAGIFEHAIVYDDARNKVILFGGETQQGSQNSTWEWDGTNWKKINTLHSPPARFDFGFVYDSDRNVAVAYGGYGGSVLGDTWEYDGIDWTQKFPAHNPPALYDNTMTYDSVRKLTLLYGGARSNGVHSDTLWTWNGTDWTEANVNLTNPHPEAVRDPAFSFDPVRGVAVLFGGYTGISPYSTDKTWEWNGTEWSLKNPINKPFEHYRLGMAYDLSQSKTILYSHKYHDEVYPGYREQQTWSWDGSEWTLLTPAINPGPRDWSRITYNSNSGKIILIGGYLYDADILSGPMADIWELNVANPSWTKVFTYPKGRAYSEMVYDSNRARAVMFGGGISVSIYSIAKLNDTWEHDGNNWIQKNTLITPPARLGHAMAFDSKRNKVILFGGEGPAGFANDTWEYDGTDWININPAHTPSARYDHMLAYDPIREKTILFGGNDNIGSLSDTWEWDGTDWSQVTSITNTPPEAAAVGMAYDPIRAKIVLFNRPDTNNYSDAGLWEFNGTNWNVVNYTPNPGHRTYLTMIYSQIFNKLFIFGGAANVAFKDSWVADNTSWQLLSTNESEVGVRHNYTLAENTAQNHILMHGGYANTSTLDQTWKLTLTDRDNDGTNDCSDDCPDDLNKILVGACGCGNLDTDSDLDGTADCNESCDNDPLKSSPGICGCNISDTDSDNDGTANCIEECDTDPLKTIPGNCGCGTADLDSDNDTILDCLDSCPNDSAKNIPGICGCGTPDIDSDQDKTFDCNDTCPNDPNKKEVGICGCGNLDQDLNLNKITDCLANQDIMSQAKKIITQLKKKSYKKIYFTKLISFINLNNNYIKVTNPKIKVLSLIKTANKQASTKQWTTAQKTLQKVISNLK